MLQDIPGWPESIAFQQGVSRPLTLVQVPELVRALGKELEQGPVPEPG